MAGKKATLDHEYRFWEGDRRTAYLEKSGKLTLLALTGGNEVWEHYSDYVHEVMGDTPATKDDTAITEQLGMLLGTAQLVTEVPANSSPRKRAAGSTATAVEDQSTGEDEMKNATATATAKKTAPAKKAAAPKTAAPKVKKESGECQCGCGSATFGNFAPGHDARLHGWEKKIARGEAKFNDYPPVAVKFMKSRGIVQGVAAK